MANASLAAVTSSGSPPSASSTASRANRSAAARSPRSQATFARFGESRWEMERDHWQPTLEGLAQALPSARLDELRSDGAARPVQESVAAVLATAAA